MEEKDSNFTLIGTMGFLKKKNKPDDSLILEGLRRNQKRKG